MPCVLRSRTVLMLSKYKITYRCRCITCCSPS